jgi:hypothetical protein
MEEINEPQDVETTEVEEAEVEETPAEPTDDTNELKARLQKLEEKSIQQRERTRLLRQELDKARKAAAPKAAEPSKAGELDETQLDYLDLKGITDSDEIDLIQRVMKSTGQTVRQALKDDYVVDKLEKLRAQKEVKEATPSSTKRTGSAQGNDLALAVQRFEATGQLPEDFKLRSAVVNAMEAKNSSNKPSWQ